MKFKKYEKIVHNEIKDNKVYKIVSKDLKLHFYSQTEYNCVICIQ